MEKWMIVYVLPLEVWMDIFCFPWITRRKFGRIVDRIGNFKFAEYAQFYLHEWGKRKLDTVYFNEDGLCKEVDGELVYLDVPQTPLPENIKSISYIRIRHFDAKTMDFLNNIRPLLNTNVELYLHSSTTSDFENLRTIWASLAPLLDDIRTMMCWSERALQHMREHLDKIRVLKNGFSQNFIPEMHQEAVNTIMDWLNAPAPDNLPKLCEAYLMTDHGFPEQIVTAIRQQFLTANTPRTFAVNVGMEEHDWGHQLAEFHLANGIGEELHGQWIAPTQYNTTFQITRHRANSGTELQEWVRNTKEKRLGRLHILYPTIGSFDAAQVGVPPVDVEQDDQQQQPSSKYV